MFIYIYMYLHILSIRGTHGRSARKYFPPGPAPAPSARHGLHSFGQWPGGAHSKGVRRMGGGATVFCAVPVGFQPIPIKQILGQIMVILSEPLI